MKLTGYQRKDIQKKIRDTIAKRVASGHAPYFADKPKPIDTDKEKRVMENVRYE